MFTLRYILWNLSEKSYSAHKKFTRVIKAFEGLVIFFLHIVRNRI